MEHQLTPPSGRYLDSDLYPGTDLGVRPGESDPGQMLGAVLLLMAALLVAALGLAWWLV